MIIKQVHQKGGKLVTSGMGKAGQIASKYSYHFLVLPIACFLHPGEAQYGDLGLFRKNDLMMLVPNSEKTHGLMKLI